MAKDYPEFLTVIAPVKAIGAAAGERLLTDVLAAARNAAFDEAGVVIAVNLGRVTLATTSYVKSGLLPLFFSGQRHADKASSGLVDSQGISAINLYPVFTNVDPEVLDTVHEVFGGRRLPVITAVLTDEGLNEGRINGYLDEALARTLRLIRGREQVTALDLAAEFSAEGIKPTAWNNRLNDLWRLRLLRRTKRGKAWWYKSVIKELDYGR